MSNNLAKFIASFFYLGYFPFASGTLASAAGVLVYFKLHHQADAFILVFILLALAGFWASGRTEKLTKEKDPSCVVIDEVVGVMIAIFSLPSTPAVIITAFFLFRAFDMFKIYPADKLETYPGAFGIMMDDIVAGVYTNFIMQIALNIQA